MASFPVSRSAGQLKLVQQIAVVVWAVPLLLTSLFTALAVPLEILTALLVALVSCSPVVIVFLLARYWFVVPFWVQSIIAFFIGVVRFWFVSLFSSQQRLDADSLFVAGVFSLFWWLLVAFLAREQLSIVNKFSAITDVAQERISNQVSSFMAQSESSSNLTGDGVSRPPDDEIADSVALLAVENEIAAAARSVGGFRSIQDIALPKLKIAEVFLESFKLAHFDVRFATLGFLTLVGTGAISNYSLERVLLTVPLSLGLFAGLLLLWNYFAEKGRSRTWLVPLISLPATVLPVLLPDLFIQRFGYSSELGNWEVSIGTPLALFALMMGSLVLTNLRKSRRRLLSDLATRIADQEMLSIYIHNSLKSEVSALILQLKDTEPGETRALLWGRLRARLAQDFADEAKRSALFPRERFLKVLDSWKPMIRINASSFLSNDSADSSIACRLAEEAIANAVRHAGATWIEIRSRESSNFRTLVFTCDQNRGPGAWSPGFGLRVLELATEQWNVKTSNGIQKLTIKLPR